jgi:parallel beta-helix repeat protein
LCPASQTNRTAPRYKWVESSDLRGRDFLKDSQGEFGRFGMKRSALVTLSIIFIQLVLSIISRPDRVGLFAQSASPLGWQQLTNTKIRPLCPSDPSLQAWTGCSAVTSAWSSAVFDSKRNRMIIWGGGHWDYAGNELYALDLSSKTMQRITDPGLPAAPYSPCQESIANGTQPNSRHTYDGITYMANSDKMFVFSGILACGAALKSSATWTFDMVTGQWQQLNPSGTGPRAAIGVVAVYDPNTGKVFVHDDINFFSYDPGTDKYQQLGSGGYQYIGQELTGVIDPVRKKLIMVGRGQQWIIDISPGSSTTMKPLGSTGGGAIVGSPSPGLAYDSANDRIVAWSGGDTVYCLNLDTNVWSPLTSAGGPGAAISAGTFGRWAYSPISNAFAVVNSIDSNAFILSLDSSLSDTIPPTVAITSPSSGSAVSGSVTVTASASDNIGVAGVQFKLDGAALGSEVAVSPYSVTWNTASLANGSHVLTATARDAAGNVATSAAVTVTVNNSADTQPPSVPTNLSAVAGSSTQVNLSWSVSTDNVAVAGYRIMRDGTQVGTSAATAYSDSGLTASTTYAYTVSAYDASSNVSAPSAASSVTTPAPQALTSIGPGCTTATYIDKDCDGYGVGKKSSASYPLGLNTTYTTGDMPDADDTDPSVNTAAQWQARWGSNNAGMVSFLQQKKGFTNTSRVFYISQSGSDSHGVVNDPSHPFRTAVPIRTALHDLQGGAVIVRGGSWTDLDFHACGNNSVCWALTGAQGNPVYVMSYPGEKVETTLPFSHNGTPNAGTYWPQENMGYVTFDGITWTSPNYDLGDGIDLTDTDHMTFRNCEFAGWHQTFFGNHSEYITIDNCVFHDMGTHAIYFGSSGMVSYGAADFDFADDSAKYLAGTSVGASHDCNILNNVLYNNGSSGYEPLHMNTYAQNNLIEGNIISYSGGTGIGLQSGVYYTIIRNNLIFDNSRAGITMSLYGPDKQAATIRYITIENNTIWVGSRSGSIRSENPSYGIEANDYSSATGHWIKDITVRNNIICSDLTNAMPIVSFRRNSYPNTWIFANNMFWGSTGAPASSNYVMTISNTSYPDGSDTGSYTFSELAGHVNSFLGNLYVNPGFQNAASTFAPNIGLFNFQLSSTSPAINAGSSGTSAIDIRGNVRKPPIDIGAYEYSSATAPLPPMNLIIKK